MKIVKTEISRYVDDQGNVAVLCTCNFGSGWSTWNEKYGQACVFEPLIVELVLKRKDLNSKRGTLEYDTLTKQIEDKAMELYGEDFYAGGAENLTVEWWHQGAVIEITDYDGRESVNSASGSFLC